MIVIWDSVVIMSTACMLWVACACARTQVKPHPLLSCTAFAVARMKHGLVYLLGTVLLLPCICAYLASDDDASNGSYSRCPYSFRVLENALYETEGNLLKMLAIFSPARKTQPSFVRVYYAFKEENGAVSNCTVQYLWVEGGFLFVQPPKIFQFSSLLFYLKGSRLKEEMNLYLILPFECRPRIKEFENGTCTCHDKSNPSSALEELTEQVRPAVSYNYYCGTSK